jgi:hypothetical protein
MKEHKHMGMILSQRIRETDYTIEKVAVAIGYTRNHMYNLFDKDELSWEIIRAVGQFIGYDFRNDFPYMPIEPSKLKLEEPGATYTSKLIECLEDKDRIAKALIEMQKKHIALLEKNHNSNTAKQA